MTYTDDFYETYEQYIQLPTVRQAHDWALSIATQNPAFESVFDLGCGKSMEYFRYTPVSGEYVGIDLNADKAHRNDVIVADYREYDLDMLAKERFQPKAIVSLFSIEVSASAVTNYSFYERLFNELNIETILTSGVYHPEKKDSPTVQVGPITSYQTLDQPETFQSEIFEEKRIVIPVDSELFGREFEVWKILERKV